MIKFYSDEDFAHEVNDSPGNVKNMKKRLRKIGKIGTRQQLSDDFIGLFNTIKGYKRKNHTTWDHAIDSVLKEVYGKSIEPENIGDNAETNNFLKEILATLKKIEQKL